MADGVEFTPGVIFGRIVSNGHALEMAVFLKAWTKKLSVAENAGMRSSLQCMRGGFSQP
jgi:hypothetical protein